MYVYCIHKYMYPHTSANILFQFISTFQAPSFFLALAYIILFTCVLYRLVQFPQQDLYTTTFSWFHFWSIWIILENLLVYFSDRKNKPIKRTEKFISRIRNLRVTVLYLTYYQNSRSMSLDSFAYDSLVKKAIPKKVCIALTNTCVNKDAFICVNKQIHIICVLILGGWYGTDGG